MPGTLHFLYYCADMKQIQQRVFSVFSWHFLMFSFFVSSALVKVFNGDQERTEKIQLQSEIQIAGNRTALGQIHQNGAAAMKLTGFVGQLRLRLGLQDQVLAIKRTKTSINNQNGKLHDGRQRKQKAKGGYVGKKENRSQTSKFIIVQNMRQKKRTIGEHWPKEIVNSANGNKTPGQLCQLASTRTLAWFGSVWQLEEKEAASQQPAAKRPRATLPCPFFSFFYFIL